MLEIESDSLLEEKFVIDDVLWKPYKVESFASLDEFLTQNKTVWPVKKFITSKGIRARGRVEIVELLPNTLLIITEIISKSINIRGWYRFLVLHNDNLLFVESKDESNKIFQEYIVPTFKVVNPTEIRINAMRIRKLAKNGTEAPVKLTLLVNNQTAGVDGLETLTLTGENIVRGIQTLKDRQEVDLKAESIGPWIEIETKSIKLEMSKGLKIKLMKKEALTLLSSKVLI
ncbi:MAG: hypothetical protein HeimC3_12590 [Candidatus Heimdallarchaeota archaeon LC_3]|nr:MAG: hypothetical protein HeimC3_12590 [Candidatus Heimdallarchaeota archaeon LC_3]